MIDSWLQWELGKWREQEGAPCKGYRGSNKTGICGEGLAGEVETGSMLRDGADA